MKDSSSMGRNKASKKKKIKGPKITLKTLTNLPRLSNGSSQGAQQTWDPIDITRDKDLGPRKLTPIV